MESQDNIPDSPVREKDYDKKDYDDGLGVAYAISKHFDAQCRSVNIHRRRMQVDNLNDTEGQKQSGDIVAQKFLERAKEGNLRFDSGGNLVSSFVGAFGKDQEPLHAAVIDLDVFHHYEPSSTPGHGHLYLNHRLFTIEELRTLFTILEPCPSPNCQKTGLPVQPLERNRMKTEPTFVEEERTVVLRVEIPFYGSDEHETRLIQRFERMVALHFNDVKITETVE